MTTDLFNMNDWLEGIEQPAEGVTIYQKPGLIAQLAKAEEALAAAKSVPTELAMGEVSPAAKVAELRRMIAQSKTVWYVSPLDRETEKALRRQHPEPKLAETFDVPPPRLADRANVEQSIAFQAAIGAWKIEHDQWNRAHAQMLEEYQEALEQYQLALGYARIAASVTYIETFDEAGNSTRRAVSMTPEQIKKAEDRLGQPQIQLIVEAMDRVATEVPSEPDPFE